MRVLLVDTSLKVPGCGANRRMPEPAHLLGMYNLLEIKKHEVKLASWPTADELAGEIQRFNPHFIGFTAYRQHSDNFLLLPEHRKYRDSLEEYAPLIKAVKKEGIKVWIGGRGATANPEYFARAYRPDVLVKGLGEIPISALSDSGFDPRQLEKTSLYCGNIDDTFILQPPAGKHWIEVSFDRPYPLEKYGNEARVIVQIGCFGRCVFCAEDSMIQYRPLEYTVAELKHVFKQGAQHVFLEGANFTADPAQAAAIIEAVNQIKSPLRDEPIAYYINTREDSLHNSLTRFDNSWHSFLSTNFTRFLVGIESFIPKKAMALGKYPGLKQAEGMELRLNETAGMLSGTLGQLTLSWILFRPQGTIEEAQTEIESALGFMYDYPHLHNIHPEAIFNNLRSADGSKLAEIPTGAVDERYALLYLWAQLASKQVILPQIHQEGKWTQAESCEWLELALRFIDHIKGHHFIRFPNGEVSHMVEVGQNWIPQLKIINGKVYFPYPTIQ